MHLLNPTRIVWLFIPLLIVLLAACGRIPGGNEPVAGDTNVITEAITAVPATHTAPLLSKTPTAEPIVTDRADIPTDTEGQIVSENGTVIFTQDDRSQSFRSLTSSWHTNWNLHTIDYDDILSGGPPRDGIPSIDNPLFISQDEAAAWLAGHEPIVMVTLNGEARAYPLQILTWHEIVNDQAGNRLTFLPSSLISFDDFRAAYPEGVVLSRETGINRFVDNETGTTWNIVGQAVDGPLAGAQLDPIIHGDHFWFSWAAFKPETLIYQN